jgi:hypothetical protein
VGVAAVLIRRAAASEAASEVAAATRKASWRPPT